MILFPHCKINLGLDIIAKRPDGYHDIDTVMYPVHGLYDSLEVIPTMDNDSPLFTQSGSTPDCRAEDNIVVKAWRAMNREFGIAGARMHLHKAIPFGAGLGGGSSDGAFALRALDKLYGTAANDDTMKRLALSLGSDVPFFMQDNPQRCTGRGEIMTPSPVSLEDYWLVIVKPSVSVSTAEAYSGITPHRPDMPLADRLALPVTQWRNTVVNAFEETVFRKYPQLAAIKQSLYCHGAVYASMSGSGSALYGIFADRTDFAADGCMVWNMRI